MPSYRSGPTTKRLILRELTTNDSAAFYALNSNPQVMRYTHEPPLESLEQARDALAEYPDFDSVGYGRWGCELKETGEVIGFCGLKYLADLHEVDVGYRLLPEFWGQGYATEACRASLSFGFDTINLKRIIALVLPENMASVRVLEKVGMLRETEFLYEGVLADRYAACR